MVIIVVTSFIGYFSSRFVPEALPQSDYEMHFPLLEPFAEKVPNKALLWAGWPFVALADQLVMTWKLVRETMGNREIWLSIVAISFFWTIGAVLFIQFPPLAKNQLLASKEVASLFLVVFSVGIAIGSLGINALLKGEVSARYAPASVVVMGAFLVGFYLIAKAWIPNESGELLPVQAWILEPLAIPLSLTLLGISTAGGFFVVPLYAFLTTRCEHDAASRTIAANNFVNSLGMILGSILAIGLTFVGLAVVDQLLLAGAMTVISAWLAWLLYTAERDARQAKSNEGDSGASNDDNPPHAEAAE